MEEIHPAAVKHLPPFITPPGQTDILFVVMTVFLIGIVLIIGSLYLRLHALPEQVAHRTHKVQMDIVAILAVISLFTHNHLYWIAALLLAFVQLPDFSTPISSMAKSLEKLAHGGDRRREELTVVPEAAMAQSLEMPIHDARRSEETLKVVPGTPPLPDKLEARS
ncbi:MAG: hypothetical protein E5X56_25800 [Mesorhizobium sp.]|uniref:hypothetical protein n=1 Tax=Mesorhizobium sp. TaxID=1871066 RepID=UPI001224C6C2|nr:hypothetical protein [Mesorhizobium sp.]TIP56152.1 MAG: hypothetical protein E5X56_25800 [Mesorhizobium sp.]